MVSLLSTSSVIVFPVSVFTKICMLTANKNLLELSKDVFRTSIILQVSYLCQKIEIIAENNTLPAGQPSSPSLEESARQTVVVVDENLSALSGSFGSFALNTLQLSQVHKYT